MNFIFSLLMLDECDNMVIGRFCLFVFQWKDLEKKCNLIWRLTPINSLSSTRINVYQKIP